jgi:exodeoxyribonuclease VII large subunit
MTGKLSLSELQLIIRDSLYMALPDFYWVVAEISEIKQNYSGHCYLELIEKQDDETIIKARIKAVIWSSRYGFIKSFFENATGESLREDLKVLVKARIEYHELYGLSLVITDIDPSYTLGEMAAKRLLIIKKLEQEGVFGMNKELEIPKVPQRIAVISSRNAAGYSDFMNHLQGNSYKYVFYTALFDAAMQGADTEQSIINALNRIASKSDLFDIVVIIRGGGSQTDLSWFDNYNIAYYVTQFPLPVITGIGHEKDLSVTDMVACKALKTPTAAADYIIETVCETENHLFEISLEIKNFARDIIEESKNRIERSKNTIAPLTILLMADLKKSLSEVSLEVLRLGKEKIYSAGIIIANRQSRFVSAALSFVTVKENLISGFKQAFISRTGISLRRNNNRLSAMENSLQMLDPVNVLKRGYTITSLNDRIIMSAATPCEGETIDTLFSDGKISSRVTGKNEKKPKDTTS